MLGSSADSPGAYTSFSQGIRSVYWNEGRKGLTRGLGTSMLGVSHGAFQFAFYEKLKEHRTSNGTHLGIWDTILISAASKIGAQTLTYPLKVIQSRVQNYDTGLYNGPIDTFNKIRKQEGLRGFYKG